MPKTVLVTNNLGDVLNDVVRFFAEAHPSIQFNCVIDPKLPAFPFDSEQINRVVTNLLDNSIAAIVSGADMRQTPLDGRIHLSASLDETLQMVTVSVADNGVGISAENKARVFEPYFSTKPSGTGLGLAIVSTIIADHHGYIRVSDNKPSGTRITFELPVKPGVADLRRKQG
jgi:two-component system nitrogen regulation sensor histidine kinase NtrY